MSKKCCICSNSFKPYNSRSLTCSKECNYKRKLQRCAEYRKENESHRVKLNKAYYIKNKEAILERKKNYERDRRNTDTNHKLKCNIRKRLSVAIRNNQKVGSAVKDLGCSIEELKKHLESQFQENMSWDNYGLHGWHIDHIKPLASFDLSNRQELLKACHYTNLQPMWANENLSKGAKVED